MQRCQHGVDGRHTADITRLPPRVQLRTQSGGDVGGDGDAAHTTSGPMGHGQAILTTELRQAVAALPTEPERTVQIAGGVLDGIRPARTALLV